LFHGTSIRRGLSVLQSATILARRMVRGANDYKAQGSGFHVHRFRHLRSVEKKDSYEFFITRLKHTKYCEMWRACGKVSEHRSHLRRCGRLKGRYRISELWQTSRTMLKRSALQLRLGTSSRRGRKTTAEAHTGSPYWNECNDVWWCMMYVVWLCMIMMSLAFCPIAKVKIYFGSVFLFCGCI
jgi:hypothetical protein